MIKYVKSDTNQPSNIKLNAIKAFRKVQADIDEMKSIVDFWEADLFDSTNKYSDEDYSILYDAFFEHFSKWFRLCVCPNIRTRCSYQ